MQSLSANTHPAQLKLKEYQLNMKKFVQTVEKEISGLIDTYQKQLRKLQQQNEKLRKKLEGQAYHDNPEHEYRSESMIKKMDSDQISPIKKFNTNSYSSAFLTPQKFPTIKPIYSTTREKMEQTFVYDDLSKSRFEIEKNRSKQLQQDLIQSLESGRSNLDLNTSRMLTLFGKEPKDPVQEEQEEQERQVKSLNSKRDSMNTSLSSICDSLDTSFHARKSRSKNQAKKKEQEKLKLKKLEEAKAGEKRRKDQGLKNLLKGLRNNVKSSSEQPALVIKASKLLNTGPRTQLSDKLRTSSKSKVMINPVPIDITGRKNRSQKNHNHSYGEKPQSILKQTSTILSKSIVDNISGISLSQSGKF